MASSIKEHSNLMYTSDEGNQNPSNELSPSIRSVHTQPGLASIGESNHPYRYIGSDRDLSLPLERHKNVQNYSESPEDDISLKKYLGATVGIVSLITENLLSHPFVVLRRQCQVYHASKIYHLQPLSLFPSIVHLHRRQGVTTLWKGLGSCLLVRGMSLAVEDLIMKVTSWPKEVNSNTTLHKFGQHIILKCVGIAIVMPFYAASLVETVQSDIASEKPGLFDVFREGSIRLFSWTIPQKGRMLPFWVLIGPSISLGLTKYIFSLIMKGVSSRLISIQSRKSGEQKGSKYRDEIVVSDNAEIYSNLIALVTSELVFYPIETIIHRLQLQGTRTIIDNLDSGYAVVPILTNYQGFVDCYRTTLATEGASGLYKGFGALLLQIAAHIAVIKLAKWIVVQITDVMSNKPPSKVVQYYNLDRGCNSNSTTISSSLNSVNNID